MNGLDEKLYRAIYGGDALTTLGFFMVAFTMIGSGWALVLAAPLIALPRTRRFSIALTGALLVQAALVWAMKLVFSRVRPYQVLGTRPPFTTPTDYSFPSGHAAGSFTVAIFIVTVFLSTPTIRGRRVYSVLALLLATAISVSRVYLGVHYPGDVTAGALLGGLVGFGAARLFLRGEARAQSAPRSAQL